MKNRFTLSFIEEAKEDVEEAFSWYEGKRAGLGSDFLIELEEALQLIEENPGLFQRIDFNKRRMVLKKFSTYSIVYEAHDQAIFIIGFIHNSRNPGYWKRRTP